MSDRSHIDQQDYITAGIRQEAAVHEVERARRLNTPSAIYRPDVFQDGNAWCALYGRDIAVGVVGWGDTPEQAMTAFDVAWCAAAGVSPKAANGAGLILQERARQTRVKGWTAEHDDTHVNGELVNAAIRYADAGSRVFEGTAGHHLPPLPGDWGCHAVKRVGLTDAECIRNLVKAGALIAAEIDRLQRQKS